MVKYSIALIPAMLKCPIVSGANGYPIIPGTSSLKMFHCAGSHWRTLVVWMLEDLCPDS